MGTYFNPGNESFARDSGDELYVDKTGLLKELNKIIGTSRCCVALSHARRFGKSQAAGMIDAYYSRGSDSKELFSHFEIAVDPDFDYTKTIPSVLKQVQEASGKTFVIILDEWDCIVRSQSNRQDLVHKYLQFLHAVFKSEESKRYLALAYITGILLFRQSIS